VLGKNYYCDIDIAHLISYNEDLAHKLTSEPADIIPLVGAISATIANVVILSLANT
jgi:DNA replication licensing factor MCM5